MRNLFSFFFLLGVIGLFLFLDTQDAFATAGTGGGLPYEGWLVKVQQSVTGPVAFVISIVGIVVAGAVLIFGGDLNGFFRTLVLLVLVAAFLVGAQNIMSGLFGKGAVIGDKAAICEVYDESRRQ